MGAAHAHPPSILTLPCRVDADAITWQKILPLGAMFFCILFNYTILRDTKVRRCIGGTVTGLERQLLSRIARGCQDFITKVSAVVLLHAAPYACSAAAQAALQLY